MFTSVIVSVFVLVTGIFLAGRRPPGALQPATVSTVRGTARRRPRAISMPLIGVAALTPLEDRDKNTIVMDSLRVLGLVRHDVERPVVGERAYVRLWERIRALVVLAAIIISIGVAVAATIGIFVLAAGFLLEQAIS